MRRWRDDAGQVTGFVVILVLAMLLAGGLVFDGGRLLAERRELHDLANGAARAGAQAMSLDALRADGATAVDPDTGVLSAREFLAASGRTGEIQVVGDTVTVTVRASTELVILRLAGVASREVVGRGSARLVRGVSRADS